jgi:hypothetical protein
VNEYAAAILRLHVITSALHVHIRLCLENEDKLVCTTVLSYQLHACAAIVRQIT